MWPLRPIVDSITNEPAGFEDKWFRSVRVAANLADVIEDKLPTPFARVIRMVETNKTTGETTGDDQIAFDIILVLPNDDHKDPCGIDDRLNRYRTAIRKQLQGADFAGLIRPIRFSGGTNLESNPVELFWRDRYLADVMLTNDPIDPNVTDVFLQHTEA